MQVREHFGGQASVSLQLQDDPVVYVPARQDVGIVTLKEICAMKLLLKGSAPHDFIEQDGDAAQNWAAW